MKGDWAAQNLQTIRTLMERAAVYRRALAPIMITVGCMGLGAAMVGWLLEIGTVRSFIVYWLAVAGMTGGVAFALVRRQAIQAREAVWSPPARRVVMAALPPLIAGLVAGVVLVVAVPGLPESQAAVRNVIGMLWLPLGWVILYGCAMHAGGVFLPRGIRWLGWIFVVGGCVVFATGIPDLPAGKLAHGIMGLFFGLVHLTYGIYLYLTEQKESEL